MAAFDFDAARRFEAKRRLALMGDLASSDYDYQRFQERATYIGIPFKVFVEWHKLFSEKGLEGLSTDLPNLDEKALNLVLERQAKLGATVDNERVTARQIDQIARQNNWSRPTAERWILRYRVDGLWGLEPHGNSLKKNVRANEPIKRDLGTLTEAELLVVYERLERLGPLAKQQRVANLEFEKRAAELRAQGIKTSSRTLRGYHSVLKREGLAGLADKERSDKGRY